MQFPRLGHVFADRIYRGALLDALSDCGPWTIEIVERPQGVKASSFCRDDGLWNEHSPVGRCRRLAKDFEAATATEVAWLLIAHIRLLPADFRHPRYDF